MFANVSQKNHDIFVKMEQAFCCGLLSPLPDVREKYMNLFLVGSDLTENPIFPDDLEPSKVADAEPLVSTLLEVKAVALAAQSTPPSTASAPQPRSTKSPKSSLLVRLLFLLVSNRWDEAHFKDGFWLPIFFDVSSPCPLSCAIQNLEQTLPLVSFR